CWVGREAERVVGYLCLWEVSDELHITNVAVHPTFRRRGVARVLLGGVLDDARQRRLRLVVLEVRPSNTEARGLYDSFGFRVFGPMVGDVVFGYSGGPVRNVTDLAPTCAGCHSSFTRDQLRNEPEAFATSQIKENKHYKAIEDGIGPYQQMSAADRQKLLADVKAMDENASMALSVPTSLRAGQEVQVTVSVKGGHGVVGVLLVDTDLRFQARPIQ